MQGVSNGHANIKSSIKSSSILKHIIIWKAPLYAWNIPQRYKHLLVVRRVGHKFINNGGNNIPLQLFIVENKVSFRYQSLVQTDAQSRKTWSFVVHLPGWLHLWSQYSVSDLYRHQNYQGNAMWCLPHFEIWRIY